jgi:hypothetical protein
MIIAARLCSQITDSLNKMPGACVLWQLAPGAHSIQSSGSEVAPNAHAGNTVYVRIDIEHNLLRRWSYLLQTVAKKIGYKGVDASLPMQT